MSGQPTDAITEHTSMGEFGCHGYNCFWLIIVKNTCQNFRQGPLCNQQLFVYLYCRGEEYTALASKHNKLMCLGLPWFYVWNPYLWWWLWTHNCESMSTPVPCCSPTVPSAWCWPLPTHCLEPPHTPMQYTHKKKRTSAHQVSWSDTVTMYSISTWKYLVNSQTSYYLINNKRYIYIYLKAYRDRLTRLDLCENGMGE